MKILTGLCCALALLLPGSAPAGGLSADGAYIPEPPPAAAVAAAYFTVRNAGDTPAVIVGVVGSNGATYAIHRSTIDGEVARMSAVERITVGAGESLRFEPGGLHVMLDDAALAGGDEFLFFLLLEDGARLPVSAQVRGRSDPAVHLHGDSGHRGDPG